MTSNLKYFKKSLLLLSLLFFISCEDRVQLKLDKQKNAIAVDAFLNDLRQDQIIRLTATDSYFSGQKPPAISGAEVTVTDLNTNKVYRFSDHQNGNYVLGLTASDTLVHSGHSYELNIRYLNHSYKSRSTASRSAKIEALFLNYEEASASVLGNSSAGYKLKMIAKDPVGPLPDFYWVKLFKNGVFYNQVQNMQLESFGLNNENDGRYFHPDRWKTNGPNGQDTCVSGDRLRIEIHGISRETYDFFSLGVKVSNNGGMFAVTSVNLPTNILPDNSSTPDAVGFFCVSAVMSSEIICP